MCAYKAALNHVGKVSSGGRSSLKHNAAINQWCGIIGPCSCNENIYLLCVLTTKADRGIQPYK